MAQMVERVARAIDDYASTLPEMSEFRAFLRSHKIAVARAAIEAMREPTPDMVNAAWGHPNYDGPTMDHYKSDVGDYWRSMIDAALKETAG